jgi:hypothetical protein
MAKAGLSFPSCEVHHDYLKKKDIPVSDQDPGQALSDTKLDGVTDGAGPVGQILVGESDLDFNPGQLEKIETLLPGESVPVITKKARCLRCMRQIPYLLQPAGATIQRRLLPSIPIASMPDAITLHCHPAFHPIRKI